MKATENHETKSYGASNLVGLYFLGDIDERRKGHQGRVIAYLVNGTYLVQFYGWIVVSPTTIGVVDLASMGALDFFDNVEDWRAAGDRLSRKNAARVREAAGGAQ